ncbi:MAG: HAD hydrolase-like protein [Candidatus Microthrix sp.]|nr:HAD family hydrolase [Candidatus Microthrix sp.]MBK6437708.1 HAD hydrolase-like protein [Candidatus Microthrix sp.]
MVPSTPPSAVIFDLDGVLIDSEPVWEAAEAEVFASVGVHLDASDTASTTGLRVDEVVAHWLARRPWDVTAPGASAEAVAITLVDAMVAHAHDDPTEVPGAVDAVDRLAKAGRRLAVCSSSPQRLIEASLGGLGLGDRFELVHSAEHEPAGQAPPGLLPEHRLDARRGAERLRGHRGLGQRRHRRCRRRARRGRAARIGAPQRSALRLLCPGARRAPPAGRAADRHLVGLTVRRQVLRD